MIETVIFQTAQQHAGWEFGHLYGTGTPWSFYWEQVEEQVPKPVGLNSVFFVLTLVLV